MKKKSHTNLPFALPDIDDDEINEVVACLKSGWLTTGPLTKKFEEQFAAYLNVKHALAVNSGTAGLHLAIEALGIKKGNKVATSVYTFTATAEVIRYLQADPVFIDIDPETLNIDTNQLIQKIDKTIDAIIPVHFAGQACEMDTIAAVAQQFELKIVEDAAHAIPCSYKGKKIGKIGNCTMFSFYVTKPMATGEGGMVVTDSDEIADRIRVMRLHGINRDIWNRYRDNKQNWYYEVIEPGFKYNMPDLMAAIGIHQLKKVHRFQKRRQMIAGQYDEAFTNLPLKTPVVANPENQHAWHLYVIQLDLERMRISRDEFIEKMAEKGIGTSVHFIPLHMHPYWRDHYGFTPTDFPVALDCYLRAVSLPIYSKMRDEDVERVIKAVKDILG
jgi:dTDP-4-amino-4,6-dideoxygalactose transaminase